MKVLCRKCGEPLTSPATGRAGENVYMGLTVAFVVAIAWVAGIVVGGVTNLGGIGSLVSGLVALGLYRWLLLHWSTFIAWDEHMGGHFQIVSSS